MELVKHTYEGTWLCCDDGTGKNIYYVNREDESRSRNEPIEYVPEVFTNGMKRYYFRGSCVRCRKKEFPYVLSMKKKSILYSLNQCRTCIIDTTPGITSLVSRDVGDTIWDKHIDNPKNMYMDLTCSLIDKDREKHIITRAQNARLSIQIDSKHYRDSQNHNRMRDIARQYGITSGKYLSWGLGKIFDEYFGEVNDFQVPHGKGVKIFSDHSIYSGNWKDGSRHTTDVGVWIRPDGYDYEGSWISDMKHGYGVLKYPNGNKYQGEFARDLEHGNGTLYYADGSMFEGRFRFGKRDGPGTLTHVDGSTIRDLYRDYVVLFNEKPLTKIMKAHDEVNADEQIIQPDSLFNIANEKLSLVIRTAKIRISPAVIREHMPDHLKPPFAEYYLKSRHPPPTDAVIAAVRDKAFQNLHEVSISSIRFRFIDMETLIFFQSANMQLITLKLTAMKLDAQSIGFLCQQITKNAWPHLQALDLSYNQLDVSSIRSVIQSCTQQKISSVRLSGCNILANGAFAIASIIQHDDHITDMDLSFNAIKGPGAEALVEALMHNQSLTSLNLRHNDIGMAGGHAFADLLRSNRCLKVLCLADNKIGGEIITMISGRLNGSIHDVLTSVRAMEINVPIRYAIMINREI